MSELRYLAVQTSNDLFPPASHSFPRTMRAIFARKKVSSLRTAVDFFVTVLATLLLVAIVRLNKRQNRYIPREKHGRLI